MAQSAAKPDFRAMPTRVKTNLLVLQYCQSVLLTSLVEPGETYSQTYISMLTQNAPVACAAVTVRLAATSCWLIRELAKPPGITPPA